MGAGAMGLVRGGKGAGCWACLVLTTGLEESVPGMGRL
jgi:hypothetical protein